MDQLPFLSKEEQDAILDGPALAAPDNVEPNFDNPPRDDAIAHFVFALCIFVSSMVLVLRLYVQAVLARKFRVEDFLTCGAYVTFIGWIFCAYEMMRVPVYFVHQYHLTVRDMLDLAYWIHVAGIFYSITLPFLKMAILLEWSRILVPRGTRGFFWWACYTLGFVQFLFMFGAVIGLCLSCIPYAAIWDKTIEATCYDKGIVEKTSSIVHLISDVIILVLPQKVIWGLQLSFQKKLGVSVIFGLGLLACVAAAFRVAVTVPYTDELDTSFSVAPVMFWATAEMTCGFVVVCVPSAPRILKETGVIRHIRRAFGMPVTTMKGTGLSSTGGGRTKQNTTTSTYRKIDEDGLPMRSLASKSESTENLRSEAPSKFDNSSIMRTTHVVVKEEKLGNDSDGSDRWHYSAGAHRQ